jgi:hypothetical protein
MDLKGTGLDGIDWIHLSQKRNQRQALVNTVLNVRFEVLTAVLTKISLFWNITPSLFATFFHTSFFLLGLFFDPEDGSDIFLRNVG